MTLVSTSCWVITLVEILTLVVFGAGKYKAE